MKVKVITTTDGKILGITQEPPLALGQDEPRAVVVPTTDQIMRETEVPDDFFVTNDMEELDKRLNSYLINSSNEDD